MWRGSVVDRDHVGPELDRNLAAIRRSPVRTFCKTQATNQSEPERHRAAPDRVEKPSRGHRALIGLGIVLERENRELRLAKQILRKASAYFVMAELDRRSKP